MSKEVQDFIAAQEAALEQIMATWRDRALRAEEEVEALQAENQAVYDGALAQGSLLALKDNEIARLTRSCEDAGRQAQQARAERDAAEAAAQATKDADDAAIEWLLLNAKVSLDDLTSARWPRNINPVTAMDARETWARRRMPSDMYVYWVPDQETFDAIMGDDRIKDGHAYREPVWLQSVRGTVAGWVAARRPLPDLGLTEVTDLG